MDLELIQNIEPKAWLYICRKKPKLRELSFKPKCLGLESMGFKPHPMVLIEEVIEILKSQSRPVHLSQLSWSGFNLHGDEKSIREAQRLLHEAAKVPALYERIDELQKTTPQWFPIDSAPEDTEVLIGSWIDGEFKWGRSVQFYEQGNELEGETFSGWVWSVDDCSDSVAEAPEFWQPLPAAPMKG